MSQERKNQIQFSLRSFLFGSIAVGAAFGLSIAQPIVIFGFLVVVFSGLLILVLIVPWFPLIEFFAAKDLSRQDLIRTNCGGAISEHVEAQEIRIWVAFLVGALIYIICNVVFSRELPPNALLLTLGSYAAALLTMLILSLLIFPWMSIGRRRANSSCESYARLAIRCLSRFQFRGWIVFLVLSLILVGPLLSWLKDPY